jgi:hypothetical protein
VVNYETFCNYHTAMGEVIVINLYPANVEKIVSS